MRLEPSLQVQELTTLADLESMEPQWTRLWQSVPAATPFQSPAWLIPWWRQFGQDNLWTLAFRRNGELVALAPLFVFQPEPSLPRTLLFLGAGISDYLDMLAHPAVAEDATAALTRWLDAHSTRWDVCDFQELPRRSPLLRIAPGNCWKHELTQQSACPVLPLSADVSQLNQMVPKRTLEKLCYYRRRATKAGPVEIALASETNFDRFFDALLRLHAGRWNARGTPGVLADAALQQFHREAARRFLALGALRLHLLRLGNREIAALYCFKSAGRTYYYLGGFDQEFSHLSPGSVLIGHAIETAVREGDGEFDFLRGQEAYKYAWGATDRFNHRLRMWHSQSATADHHRGSEPGKDLVYGSSTRTNQSAVA